MKAKALVELFKQVRALTSIGMGITIGQTGYLASMDP